MAAPEVRWGRSIYGIATSQKIIVGDGEKELASDPCWTRSCAGSFIYLKEKKNKGKRDRERLEFWVQCEGLFMLLGLLLN